MENLFTEELVEVFKQKAVSWILLYEFYATDRIDGTIFVDMLRIQNI